MFKPMLAGEAVLGQVKYPKVSLPKLNGVRGCNQDGVLLARSLKPIGNRWTARKFSGEALANLEGELIVGTFDDEEVFVKTTSGVGKMDGLPDVRWYIFDMFHPTLPYLERLTALLEVIEAANNEFVVPISWKLVHNDEEMDAHAQECLLLGYEGTVLRDPSAKYKQGRSTDLEGGFLRYCPWFRSEMLLEEVLEGKTNNNEPVKNELGHTSRSTHKANMISTGMAGSVRGTDVKTGIQFKMTVPDEALGRDVWDNWLTKYKGKFVKYKFKPAVKIGGKPRFPQWEGIRDPIDMVDY